MILALFWARRWLPKKTGFTGQTLTRHNWIYKCNGGTGKHVWALPLNTVAGRGHECTEDADHPNLQLIPPMSCERTAWRTSASSTDTHCCVWGTGRSARMLQDGGCFPCSIFKDCCDRVAGLSSDIVEVAWLPWHSHPVVLPTLPDWQLLLLLLLSFVIYR